MKRLVIWAMVSAIAAWTPGCQKEQHAKSPEQKQKDLHESLSVNLSSLKSADNQPLIIMDDSPLVAPPRPDKPDALSDDDALRWYDREYAGWNVKKAPMPPSPADGCRGKRVTCLRFCDHPYLIAYTRGMTQVADAYGIVLKTMDAQNSAAVQAQQVDQAISEKPDMVIITPVTAESSAMALRKLYRAGIPVIASNLLPTDEAMQYVLAWTGPDDWGQFRMLARDFARRMNGRGGYCIVRHYPGGSPFFSRTYAVITELKKIAPEMKLLDMQTTNLEATATEQLVSGWLKTYGADLKGIVSADDSGAQIGINSAIAKAGREDILRVAAGNSKVGMDFVKAGTLHAITYQSPQADGALPMKLAADWFLGRPIARGVYYLPKKIIAAENVDQFMPSQW